MQKKPFLAPVVLLLGALLVLLIGLSIPRPATPDKPPATAVASPVPPDAAPSTPSASEPSDQTAAASVPATPSAGSAAASLQAAGTPPIPALGSAPTRPSVVDPTRFSAAAVSANPVAPVLDLASSPAWPSGFTFYRTPAEILAGKDLSDPVQRAQAVAEMGEAEEVRYNAVLVKADQMGIPVRIEGPGHRVRVLYDIREEGPLYRTTLNTNAAISTGANLLNQAPYGLNGQGMTVGVWDAARARTNHVELVGKVTIKDGTTANDDHSTHVAGTIAAKGVDPRAKGMGTNTLIHSYDWNNDYAEMTSAGAATAADGATKLPISNHSYGYGATNADMGRYETEASTTDGVANGLPYYLIFWAAGNEQTDLPGLGGYQSITFVGLAKNILTVGAADDAVTSGLRDPSKATLAYFSSMGPCDDGRIKPDVVANGVDVYSCVATSTNSYDGTYSGTSMATPNAAGSAALLQQLYKTNFSGQLMRASMLKGLLIHTADDRGRPGPDYQYGWGLVNVKAAADIITAQKASLGAPKMIEGTISATNKVQSYNFAWDGTNPIRATLVWTDPAGAVQTATNSRTRNLVHDLDVKITAPDGTTTYLPYVMPFVGTWTTNSMTNNAVTGTNRVDNVERVDLAAPTQPGNYTVTVGMYGTNVLTTNQVYSLIVTGGADVPVNPSPVVSLDAPTNGTTVLPSTVVNLAASATDTVIGGGPGVVTKVEFLNGTNVISEDFTAPYGTSWTPPGSGTYSLAARATDSEGAVSTSAAVQLNVLTGDGTPVVSSFSPTSGRAGTSVTITGSNLAGATSIKFNGVDATAYLVDSATQITASVPGAATTGPISVVTSYGTGTSATNFTVVQSPILISQVYGAGGNSGATYNADYVELYNRSGSPVDVSGWTIQYASSSGTTWSVANLTGSIGAGKYFLVKLSGGATGAALPTPDVTSTAINMSGTSGKVALRSSSTAFTGSSPIGASGLEDFVGYGSANAFEGAAAPSPSTTTAIFRAGGGATDTGSNSADFTASTPNPRNSGFGGGSAPVISSPLTATGTVGQAFTYNIVASNAPTSYNAVGLPAGLSVNTSSGAITGTPTIAGTNNVTISAANGSGTDSKTLVVTVNPAGGGGASYIVDFEDGSKTAYASSNVTLNGISWNMTEALIGSGDANDFKNGAKSARLRGYSNSVITMLSDKTGGIGNISLQHRRYGTDSQVEWIVDYSTNSGANWTEAGRFIPGTNVATFSADVNVTNSARVRIRTAATGASNRRANVDDINLTSVAAALPTISTSGTLTNVHTVYGAASTNPTSFTLSGTNMTAGILVTPPPGFEVSQTAGGASGYAATQTVGAAGTISNTPVYLRLAAGTTAGQYSGNVVCSSAGASSVNVAVPPSNVAPKGLTITANNQSKPFGGTLALGPGQTAFTPSGLVLGETVGTVTLVASGGTAANDAAGVYDITPSDVTGGTFTPSNYDIGYAPGVLTVTGQTYGSWSAGLADPSTGADLDRDGFSNLAEYYLGRSATTPDSGMTAVAAPGALMMDYPRSKNTDGVTGTVKWSTALDGTTPWSTNGITDQFLSDHGSYEMRRATLPLAPGDNRRFLRLEIIQP